MNIFNQFLIFPLRKFEPFRDYVYYSLVDKEIYFIERPGENELIITSLQPYVKDERVASGLVYPVIFNRDFTVNQTLNHGRPIISDVEASISYSLSVLTFSRAHSASIVEPVQASFYNQKGEIEYINENKPRFEYTGTRQNVLCSSEVLPDFPASYYNTYTDSDGIVNVNLAMKPISGANLPEAESYYLPGDNGSLYPRALYGWQGWPAYPRNITKTNDIPSDLQGTNTAYFFNLSGLVGNSPAGDSEYAWARNAVISINSTTGSKDLPYLYFKERGIPADIVTGQWRRYSITFPSPYWAGRVGGYNTNWIPQGNLDPRKIWGVWGTYSDGAQPNPRWGYADPVPLVRPRIMQNGFGSFGTFSFWGPQLEFGLSATAYQYTGYAVTSGSVDTKNLVPPLSTLMLTGPNLQPGPRWTSLAGVSYQLSANDTPFGFNNTDPAYVLKGLTTNANGSYADILLRLPERSKLIDGTNLLNNTDYSGAEVGDLQYWDGRGSFANINRILPGWNYAGRAPYHAGIAMDNLGSGNSSNPQPTTVLRVVSTGQIDGFNFVDYKCTRLSVVSRDYREDRLRFNPDTWLNIRAQNGETFTASVSCAVIDGQLPTPMYFGLNFPGWSGTPPFTNISLGLNGSGGRTIQPTALLSSLSSIVVTRTANDSKISRVNFEISTSVARASTFDFTFRVCGPKLERGPNVTSYVPSPTITNMLSTMTFSCYIRHVNGNKPTWQSPSSLGTQGGLMQRIAFLNPDNIHDGTRLTFSMYAKIAGPLVTDSTQLLFAGGLDDVNWRSRNQVGNNIVYTGQGRGFYCTNKWQRFQFTAIYKSKPDFGQTIDTSKDSLGRLSDGKGFFFYIDTNWPENISLDRNRTQFYFTAPQVDIETTEASAYLPTGQGQIAIDNTPSGILIEPTRTNIALHSTNYATTSTGNVVVQTSSIVAPDLTKTCSEITGNSRTSFLYLTGCNIGKPNTRYTVSFFVKKAAASTVLNFAQHPSHTGSSIAFTYDLDNDNIYNIVKSNTTDTVGREKLVYGWYRIYYTTLCNSSGLTGKIWPGFNIPAIAPNNKFLLWGLQIEEGDSPTSYIPVSGYTSQRGRDILTLSGVNVRTTYDNKINISNVSINTGTIYLESYRKYSSTASQSLLQLEELINNNKVIHNVISYGSAITTLSSTIFSSSITITTPASWVASSIKTAFSYNNSNDYFALAANGVSLSNSYTNNLKLTAVNFGGPEFIGYIRKILIFPEAMNLTDIKTITT